MTQVQNLIHLYFKAHFTSGLNQHLSPLTDIWHFYCISITTDKLHSL